MAMIKGKPITTSVPAIRYHASDDELEELYPSTDDEKRLTPEFGEPKTPTKTPSKTADEKLQDEDSIESNADGRTDSTLPEGTPPSSDPWKVFSEIRGKITKTFEEKLSEIKNDKRKKSRSPKGNSSISDSEDLGDATPSDENTMDKQRTESAVSIVRRRGNPTRYVGFSKVKTGLKDKSMRDDCVESGVEAAEFTEDVYRADTVGSEKDVVLENKDNKENMVSLEKRAQTHPAICSRNAKPEVILSQLIYRLIWQLASRIAIFFCIAVCLYCFTPLPECILGFATGFFLSITLCNAITRIKQILTTSPDDKLLVSRNVPVLEIPAVEEHAVIERFEGWLNELPYSYNPDDYHVARTKSVFFRLEGHVLRIMETKTKVPKRTVWDEPRHKLKFTRRRVYDLLDAKVDLLPHGLIRRRRWSKKYPICVTLKKEAVISNIPLKYATDDKGSPFDEKTRRPMLKRKALRKRRVCKQADRSRQSDNLDRSLKVSKEDKLEEDDAGDDEGDDTDDDLEEEEEDEELEEIDLDIDLDPFSYEDDLADDSEEEEFQREKKQDDQKNSPKEKKEFNENEADEEADEEDVVDVEKIETTVEQDNAKDEDEKEQNSKEKENEIKLFIFARADRQKEDWYRRLVAAASESGTMKKQVSSVGIASDAVSNAPLVQHGNVVESKVFVPGNNTTGSESIPELSYSAYMAKCLETRPPSSTESGSNNTDDVLWINCLIARILFDVHNSPETINLIQDKIQRKLSNIKLPYFMECLLVSEVIIGQGAPVIRKVSKPVTDERGLWIDLDITYKGCLTMTVETKLNLMKLTRTGSVSSNTSQLFSKDEPKTCVRSPIFDSDVEDTPETSTEDDDSKIRDYAANKEPTPAQSSGKKFLSMVDKIAANKYFQHATELSYVRRAMEGVSNTEIRLMVTISGIEGCLSVNIPPAPSDRLWYGFRPVPKISLTVQPALGERTLNIAYVTKWIETKLLKEFEKLVVLPNMDDLVLPLCPNYPYASMMR